MNKETCKNCPGGILSWWQGEQHCNQCSWTSCVGLLKDETLPDIYCFENGYIWKTPTTTHVFYTSFGKVHRKLNFVQKVESLQT